MFFRHRPKKQFRGLNYEFGSQSFGIALIMISMYRFDAGLVNIISAIEAFTTDDTKDDGNTDQRTIWKKLEAFEQAHPSFGSDFQRRSESSKGPKANFHKAYQLRNRLMHSGHSAASNPEAAKAILDTLLPLVQTVYRAKFEGELYEHLVVEIERALSLSQYLKANSITDEAGWLVAMLPIVWAVQRHIRPNFEPRYLADQNGFYVDDSETVFRAVSQLQSTNGYDDETLFCPVCNELSVAVKFDFTSSVSPFGLYLSKATCVVCGLELGGSSAEVELGKALFDDFLTDNEPRLAKEFGLA